MLIGTDRALFQKGSVVRERITALGVGYFDALDSVVLSTRRHGVRLPSELAPNVHAYPTNSQTRFLYGWDAFRIASKLTRPDMISAQDPFETGLLGLVLSWYLRVPFVVEVHTDFLASAYARHSLLNRLRVYIAHFVIRRARAGYAVSSHVQRELAERFGNRTPFSVLPIFVDTSRFAALARTPIRGELLWIGRFTHEKNPGLALRAVAQARATGQDVRLTVLGEGPLEASLRSEARTLGIEPYVRFEGFQDPAGYFPTTELLLVTSDYEGYGMALIEALAAGVPVLATDVGVAREAGALVTSSDRFAEALTQWLAGDRGRGVLQLQGYPSEGAYLARTAEFYTSHLTSP